MQYFDEADGRPERVGKVIGDVFSAFIYVFVVVLMLSHFT
jgi:hypothetical protein